MSIKNPSFSSQVKDELCAAEGMSDCCAMAQTYGLLLFGRSFSVSSICLVTEHAGVADAYEKALADTVGVRAKREVSASGKITVTVENAGDRKKVIDFFGHSDRAVALRINFGNIADDCCFSAFFRGAFLSCGTITDPEKNYHLEFIVQYLKLSNDLVRIAQERGFSPKITVRKGNHVVYLKESIQIEDILTSMGATESSLEIMGVKIEKNMRNMINRKVNFETANIDRTVDAAITQIEAIKALSQSGRLDTLRPELKELALLRVENPESTLEELGKMLEKPVSRSGVCHRLNRLMQLAKETQ